MASNLVYAVLLILSIAIQARGQAFENGPQWTNEEHLGQPRFDLRMVERISDAPELSRVDIVFEVAYDFLQFVRTDSGEFEAKVEIGIAIEKKGGGEVSRQVKSLQKSVLTYEETNSRRDHLCGTFTLEQPPGDYEIKIILTDRESDRQEKLEREISLKSHSDRMFEVSDLMLMKTSGYDIESRLPNDPITGGIAGDPSGAVYVLFDLRREDPMAATKAQLKILDRDGHEVYRDSLFVAGGRKVSAYVIPIPLQSLTFGKYQAHVIAEQNGESVVKAAFFSINTFGLPRTILDIDQAIKQLKYIATNDEVKELNNQFPSRQEEAFISFWNGHYPTPGETVNGKMVEYYSRIDYANEHFTTTTPGWETDRGKILAIYGRPSEVERNVFEEDGTPYEVWYYNHLSKRFVFRDDYGFGDYRLVTPAW